MARRVSFSENPISIQSGGDNLVETRKSYSDNDIVVITPSCKHMSLLIECRKRALENEKIHSSQCFDAMLKDIRVRNKFTEGILCAQKN